MRKYLLIVILLYALNSSVSAQFVGDATGTPSSNAAAMKMIGTFKLGAAMPLAEFKTIPGRYAIQQYSTGVMGVKTGFFVEGGMGMNLTGPDKPVGFYYFPVVASYWRTSFDWNELGGFFTDKTIYTKPVSVLDIAQRYGIAVKPVKDFTAALYYRPGLIIPFKFEITHESPENGESFLFTGEMGTGDNVPVLMMSHTAGLSLQYKMVSLSFEYYSAKPTYSTQYKDIRIDPPLNVNMSSTGKIPVKLLMVSLALVH